MFSNFTWRYPLAALSCLLAWSALGLAAPTIQTIVPTAGSTVNSLTQIAVTFSEAVTGVDANDLLINNDAAVSVSGSGAGPYTFTFTQPQPGPINISWDFDHGIAGLGTGPFQQNTWSYTLIDTIAPTIALISSSVPGQELQAIVPVPGSTVGSLTQAEVTFSEPVTGVDASDLLINSLPATGLTGSGAGPYLFTFIQPNVGTVNFRWATSSGIQDLAATPNLFAGGNWTVTRSGSGQGSLVINEFLTANATGLADEDGDQSGWIEIYNPGASPVSLLGWALTNDTDIPGMWLFPNRSLAAGSYLVVFASSKDRRPTTGNLHTNFKLNATGGYLALMGPQSPRTAVSQSTYPVQRYDFSYGSPSGGGSSVYFSPPSPGGANTTASFTSITAVPQVSVNRGFFKDPFSLVMSCPTPNTTIRYTTDGTVPITTSTVYTAPLTIGATTILRMVAFGTGMVPSATVTESYIFLDLVVTQSPPPYDNPSNANDDTNPQPPNVGGTPLPVNWGTSGSSFPGLITNLSAGQVPADYGMRSVIYADPNLYDDTGAVNNVSGKTNLARINQGFRDLPILSVVLNPADMWGSGGMYSHSTQKGATFEKPCSLEMILPDGSTAFATTSGIRIHGNSSRSPESEPKHGFSVNFKGDYGAANLDYKLFPDSPAEKLDNLVLRADYNSSWTHWDGSNQRPKGTRQRDAFCKDLFRGMGDVAGHHRYVNLFIDGIYWGTYDITEKESDTFGANYFGGDSEDYDVYEQGQLKSGTNAAYSAMTSITSPIDTTKYELMKQYLDIPEFADYMLLHFYVGHEDWGDDPNKNWYAIRNRTKNGTFKYLPWDQENLLWNTTDNRTGVSNPPSGLHTKLVTNLQYKLDFADRVQKHMVAPDGALQPATVIARWNKWRALLTNAIVGESARWGDYRHDVHQYSNPSYVLYTWNQQWVTEHNRLTGTYFPVRTTTVLSQIRSAGLYPTLNAPEYHDATTNVLLGSQRVAAGYQVKLAFPSALPSGTTSAGSFYYTLDGSDPRVIYTGDLGATAHLYTPGVSPPITINATTVLNARTLNGTAPTTAANAWSAMNSVKFTVGFIPSPVIISEIMYNPPGSIGGTAAEFIELQNISNAAVDMSGWSMDGVSFIFPSESILGAGDRLVLASNNAPATFASQYQQVVVAGYYSGSLDNGGQRLALLDASGNVVYAVNYDDESGWPTAPDGSGYSLEIIDPNGDPDDATNWKASAAIKGTPGAPNSASTAPSIELSEILASNVSINVGGAITNYVELHNTTAGALAVTGWSLSNDGTPRKFVFPANSTIAAGGYLVVVCDAGSGGPFLHTGFTISGGSAGGQMQLYASGASPVRVDAVAWGNQVADRSIGKIGGVWQLTTATPGAVNAAASVGTPSNLALNEWLANPAPGGRPWLEIYNKSGSLPVPLKGVYVQNGAGIFEITSLSFVAPNGYIQLFCDQDAGADHLDLSLAATGATLSLLDHTGGTIDTVTFGPQTQGFSQGRNPDGTANIVTFVYPTPAAANYLSTSTGLFLNEVLVSNVNGAMTPWLTHAGFVELSNSTGSAVNLNATGIKLGLSTNPAQAWAFPAGASIPANGFFAVWCDTSAQAQPGSGADLNAGLALNPKSGTLYLFNAAGQIIDSIGWGFQIADTSFGLNSGTWKLLASPTRTLVNSGPADLGVVGNLKVNEWLAQSSGSNDWLELYNLDAKPVAMAGLYLTDDPSEVGRTKFQIPPLSFIAGHGWVKWEADSAPEAGHNHVNFSLDAGGEALRLSNNDANLTEIDAVSFGQQATNISQGRIPDGAANIVSMPGSPTPGAKNVLLPAPSISTHPLTQTVGSGNSVTLRVAGAGSDPLTYQWMFNGAPIAGATSPMLTFNPVTVGNDGSYTCVLSNTAGTATSNTARLTVSASFTQWSSFYFTAGELGNPAISGATADADGDGISNLQEFFHHLDPRQPATATDRSALPQAGMEVIGPTTYVTLTFRQSSRATFSGVALQASTALETGPWATVTPDVVQSLGNDPITGDPIVRWKLIVQTGQTKKFLRLQITQ